MNRSAAIRVIPCWAKSEGRAVEKSRISLWNYINHERKRKMKRGLTGWTTVDAILHWPAFINFLSSFLDPKMNMAKSLAEMRFSRYIASDWLTSFIYNNLISKGERGRSTYMKKRNIDRTFKLSYILKIPFPCLTCSGLMISILNE